MATTTPNYGWDVPTSTDYVKDGAVAIETLGDDIDASLFSITGGKNVGLVHINTTTFTTAASVQADNIFTTSFNNYRIVLDTTAAAGAGNITATLRTAAPADLNAASYTYVNTGFSHSSPTTPASLGSSSAATSCQVGFVNAIPNNVILDLLNVSIAQPTMFNGISNCSSASDIFGAVHSGAYKVSVAAFGIRFNFASNCTGTLRIYGYRNS
jgi:hypothetical protein